MRWLAAAAALLVPSLALAQPRPEIADAYVRQSWGTEDGLPQNSVTAILQTRDGYLWLGTFGGLARFDGHAFTIFNPSNTPGLASARVVGLHEDRQGILWIATQSGLVRHEAGRFRTYSAREGLERFASLGSDSRGRAWLAAMAEPMRLDDRSFDAFPSASGAPLAFAETPDGSVWVGTLNAIERFPNGDMSAPPEQVAGSGAFSLLVDTRGGLWAGSHVLRRWNGSHFTDVPLGLEPSTYGRIVAMAEDHEGALWLATADGGVLRWRDGVTQAYRPADGLPDGFIRSITVDRDGNIWVGTNLGGLDRLKPRRIHSYTRPGEGGQSIGPIVGDGAGGLWIGATCGGLLRFREGTLRVDAISARLDPCNWALHRDADGTLWVGSSVGALTRIHNGQLTRFTAADGLPGTFVSAITRDRDGALWVATDRGLARMDDDSGRFAIQRIGGLSDRTPVTRLVAARDGGLWIGHSAGLTRLHRGEARSWSQADGLSHHHVRDIYEDDDGVLWIGTYAGGLNRLEDGRFTVYQMKDGLFDNVVSRIIDDGRGNFWMSGNNGIFRVARSQLNDFAAGRIGHVTAVSYGTADGMITNETNGGSPAGWRTDDGRLWFPTIRGLVGIEPVATASTPPPVFVERAIVQGRTLEPGPVPTLGPGAIDAEFHYTAVDLSAAEKTRFRYRLDGYDRDWIDAGARRVAYYTKIPPGSYHFLVAATDSDGVWSATPLRMPVTIRPFWWQRTETGVAAVFALMAITALGVRHVTLRRSRARVAELERAQALDRERSRIARDLHDDLGTRLSHIAILAGAGDPDRRVAVEAVAAVRTMDELVWAVNARNDTVESLAYYLAQFVEEHVAAAGLRYRLRLPPDLPAIPLASDTRRHVFLAVKEAVTNAIKHASASEIAVSMDVDPHGLAIAVADDGIGLPPGVDPTGNGLRNFQERMRLAGGALSVEAAPGRGTRLTFAVPLPGGAHGHAPDAGRPFGTE